MRTVFCGERIFAVSAMKYTPQKNDHVRLSLRRLDTEPQRVTDEIGQVVNLGQLVVVNQDDRILFFLQFGYSLTNVHRSLLQ